MGDGGGGGGDFRSQGGSTVHALGNIRMIFPQFKIRLLPAFIHTEGSSVETDYQLLFACHGELI